MVLGMHRSGTSALTRAMSLFGASLPENLMPAVDGNNTTGFWESQPIAILNDKILQATGSRWDDFRAFRADALPAEIYGSFQNEIRSVLEQEFGDAPFFILKDPRISRLSDLYETVLADMGVQVRYVISFRNPLSVIASLKHRDRFSDTYSSLLWLRHQLSAELATRHASRCFVAYEALVANSRTVLPRVWEALGLPSVRPQGEALAEIEGFLSTDEQHHQSTLADMEESAAIDSIVKDAYRALIELQDTPASKAAIDRLDAVRLEFETRSGLLSDVFYDELRERERLFESKRVRAAEEFKAQRASLQRELGDARTRETSLQRQLTALQTKEANLRKELDASTREGRGLRSYNANLSRQIDAMQRSSSWKITRPLRGVKRALKEPGFAAGLARVTAERFQRRISQWEARATALLRSESTAVSPDAPNPKSSGNRNVQSPRPVDGWRPAKMRRLKIQELLQPATGQVISDPSIEALKCADEALLKFGVPQISVIIPSWNREATIVGALESAFRQTLPPYEVLLSDDGSTDRTLDIVRERFGDEIDNGRLKILTNPHLGVSAARNAALAAATGEIAAYLDSDNTWRPDYLKVMAAAFAEADEICCAYAGLLHQDLDSQVSGARGRAYDRQALLRSNFIDMNVFMHRLRLREQFGGFREDLTRLVDWEFILRYTRLYQPAYIPFIGANYFLSSSLSNITRTQDLEENYQAIARIHRAERISLGVDPLKVAYFIYDFPALSQTFVFAEIKELLKRGVDVKIYYAVDADAKADLDFDIETYRVADEKHFASLLIEHGRNICHSHFAYPGVTKFVRPACKLAHVHYTFMPHAVDIFHHANRERSQVGDLGADELCLKVFVYGDFHREFLQSQGVPREKIAYTFQAIEAEEFALVSGGVGEQRRDGVFRIAAIGRFIEKKGFGYLVDAVARLANEGVELDLYGYGPLEDQLRARAAELGAANIHFRGVLNGQPALLDAYRNADVLIAPCVEAANGDIDGFPTVILEAMMAGVPVIATAVSAIPDFLRNGVEALVVEPNNAGALAKAITELRTMPPARRKAIVRRARNFAGKLIGADKTVQRLLDAWTGYTVDIVLVTFNNEKYNYAPETFEIIDRIRARTTTQYTLTIIDNDSDPEFWAELVERIGHAKDIRLIRNKENVYCGPAANVAISSGNSEFAIYVCSNEGFVKKHGWERTLIDSMRQKPDAGMAGHLVHLPKYVTGKELTGHPDFVKFRNRQFAEQNPSRRFAHVQGGLKVMRRSAFESVGGYNPATPQGNMDVELSYLFEASGLQLEQLNEVAAITQKTRPVIASLIDEHTCAAHPSDLVSVGRVLDALSEPGVYGCNLCGERFAAFSEPAGECPSCGSVGFERLVFRILANAPYIHRGGSCLILAAAPALSKTLSGGMFKRVASVMTESEFKDVVQQSKFSCIILDPEHAGADFDEVLALCGHAIESLGEIIVAEPADEEGFMVQATGSSMFRAGRQWDTQISDLDSERLGYDWRRLIRMRIMAS